MSDPLALLILLLGGHVLGDFLFQTRAMAEAKRGHGVVILASHLAVVLPMLSLPVAGVVVGIALLHVGIDAVSHPRKRRRGALTPFVVDQLAHGVVILLGWGILVVTGAVPEFRWLPEEGVSLYLTSVVVLSAFAFSATGGAVLVDGVLTRVPDGAGEPDEEAGHEGAGRLIGILERTLVLLMVLYGQWGAIALLVAAKSIARFEQIKVRRFAEYYLVGTLASLLVALLIGLLLTEVLLPMVRGR